MQATKNKEIKFTVVSLRANDKDTYDLTFWSSPRLLESYCETILKDNGKNFSVRVLLGAEAKPRAQVDRADPNMGDSYDKFVVHLPTINPDQPPKKIYEDIMLRSVFLRHELAHLLYSDFDLLKRRMNQAGNFSRFFWNCLEDARIEKLFGDKYSGARDPIQEVNKFYLKKVTDTITNILKQSGGSGSLDSFGLYLLMRAKGFKIDGVPAWYEEGFRLFPNFDSAKTAEGLLEICEKLSDFAERKLNESSSNQKQDKKDPLFNEKNNQGTAEPKNSDEQSEDSDELRGEQESEGAACGEGNNEDHQNGNKPNEQSEDSDADELTDGANNSESEEFFKGDEFGGNDSDSPESTEDFLSEMMGRKKKASSDQFNKKISDTVEDLLEKLQNAAGKEGNAPPDMNEFIKELAHAEKQTSDQIDELSRLTDRNAESIFESSSMAMIFPMDELIINRDVALFTPYHPDDQIKTTRINRFPRRSRRITQSETIKKTPEQLYLKVVNDNSKVINDAVAYLKQKFQAQAKMRILRGKEEGLLDTYNLAKIFAGDTSIFARQMESIAPQSTVVLLFDFSGSMSSFYDEAMTSAIIFNEILDKLKIKREIYFFTGISYLNMAINKRIAGDITKIVRNGDTRCHVSIEEDYNSSSYYHVMVTYDARVLNETHNDPAVMLRARSFHEKDSSKTKKVLGSMLAQKQNIKQVMGSTPEPACILKIYSMFAGEKNKKLIVVNDGGFNRVSNVIMSLFDKEISKNISKLNTINSQARDAFCRAVKLSLARTGKFECDFGSASEALSSANIIKQVISDATKASYDHHIMSEISRFFTAKQRVIRNKRSSRMLTVAQSNKQITQLTADRAAVIKELEIEIWSREFEPIQQAMARSGSVEVSTAVADVSLVINGSSLKIELRTKAFEVGVTTALRDIFTYCIQPKIIQFMFGKEKIGDKQFLHYFDLDEPHKQSNDKTVVGPIRTLKKANLEYYASGESGDQKDHLFTRAYARFFDKMKREGWHICGFGIHSEIGRDYLGENFSVLDSVDDIKKNFSLKLRQII